MITPSTILILSAWLLAMSMGRMLPSGTDVYSMLAGLGGVTAYSALELVAKRRRSAVARRRGDEAVQKLEREVEEIDRLNKTAAVSRRSLPT